MSDWFYGMIFFAWKIIVLFGLAVVTASTGLAGVSWVSQQLKLEIAAGVDSSDFSFHFKNSGKQAIVIDAPVVSCGCTSVKLDKSTYEAGESGILQGVFTATGRHGLNAVTITIKGHELDGEVRRPFEDRVRVTVIIPEMVKISPGVIVWRQNAAATSKVIRFVVNDAVTVPLKFKSISNENFAGEWRELVPGVVYELIVIPRSMVDLSSARVTVEGVNQKTGKTLLFYAHLAIR